MAMSSDTRPLYDQLFAEGMRRGLDSNTVRAKLAAAGYGDPSQAQQGSSGPDLGRMAGLAARGALQAFPGLTGGSFFGPGSGGAMVGLGNQGQAADLYGLPQPQTPGERIGMSAVQGAASSLPFGTGVSGALLGAGANAAGQTAAENGAGPLGQLAASAAVGAGIPVAGALLSGAIRSALRGAGERAASARNTLDLIQAGDPNAPVTLGQVASGGAARTIEGGLKNVPGGQGPFKQALDQQAQAMGKRVEDVASTMGRSASKEVVGAAVTRGIEEGFIPNFRTRADQLYQKVFSQIPPQEGFTLPNTTQLMAKQNDLMGMARELSDDITNPAFAGILTNLDKAAASSQDGTIPFGVLKELRSRLGAMLTGDELIPGINLRDVSRLYGSLSDDIEANLAQKNPDAMAAWNRAQQYWKAGQDRIQNVLEPVVSKRTPEQVMNALMSGTKDGATVLRSTLRSLPVAERGLVRSNVLRQLGQDDQGNFIPEIFLRKLYKISPTARSALFEGDAVTAKNLGDLADVAEARRAAGRTMFNTSGTAQNTAFFSIMNGLSNLGSMAAGGAIGANLGGSPGAVMGALTVPLTANLTARAFTSPRIVEWLVRQTKVPYGALAQELALLTKQAQDWSPADKATANDLSAVLTGLDWRKTFLATAAADALQTRSP